jgi:hypothetical protein
MALELTQSLIEISTRTCVWGAERGQRVKSDLTTFSEAAVKKMWEPRRLNDPVGVHSLLQDFTLLLLSVNRLMVH